VTATLALLEQRLRPLRLVLCGEVAAALLPADRNRVGNGATEDAKDVLLTPRRR